MPEGPEVETVRLGLAGIIGKTISEIKISSNKKYQNQQSNLKNLQGSRLIKIERKGKFLLWFFERDGKQMSALNHLGMTGVWYHYGQTAWKQIENPFQKYKHYKLYFGFSDGDNLLFSDTRTFGQFKVMDPKKIYEVPSIATLGPDMLTKPFDIKEFVRRIRGKHNNRKVEIGKALLNPKIIAGCGNIYKSESLFKAKINPFNNVNNLSDKNLVILGNCLSEVGELAMKNKGTTLRDYAQVDGYSGLMQNKLLVYDKKGDPCSVCDSEINAAKQGDRTTYWCNYCQSL